MRDVRRQSTRAWVNRPGGWVKEEPDTKEDGGQHIGELRHAPFDIADLISSALSERSSVREV